MNRVLSITKAISDQNRLRILLALSENTELCACQITELLQTAGATVSRHLTVLTHAGLIQSRKQGRWVYFCLIEDPANSMLLTWLTRGLKDTAQIVSDRTALGLILSENPEDICRKQRGESCCPVKETKEDECPAGDKDELKTEQSHKNNTKRNVS